MDYSRSSAIFGFYREDQVSQLGERCNVRRVITWPGSRFLMRDPFLATAPTAEAARQASRPWRNSFSMKRFADEPHLWHNTSSKIDECADSAPKGWVFSKRIAAPLSNSNTPATPDSIDHRITLISVFSVSNVSPRFPDQDLFSSDSDPSDPIFYELNLLSAISGR
ncbi:hypothetical protein K0M31_008579 [Melipona bicolor]|uniref:Uncharacterized protein n=1 Tax=Melipona bicolor TaxID=60889 RepID=A0AA40KJP5_9HYME|nr:hypothetical protein K0M31_008579 [Melipona bicolor]